MWLFSLVFAETDVAEHVLVEGPMSRGNLASMRERWTTRLANFTKGLEEERKQYVKEYKKAADESKAKIQAQHDIMTERAKKALESEHEKTELQKIAHEYLNEGKEVTPSDLPIEYRSKIEKVEHDGDLGICTKCHYSSGCLLCDKVKATRYYMRKFCEVQGIPIPPAYKYPWEKDKG